MIEYFNNEYLLVINSNLCVVGLDHMIEGERQNAIGSSDVKQWCLSRLEESEREQNSLYVEKYGCIVTPMRTNSEQFFSGEAFDKLKSLGGVTSKEHLLGHLYDFIWNNTFKDVARLDNIAKNCYAHHYTYVLTQKIVQKLEVTTCFCIYGLIFTKRGFEKVVNSIDRVKECKPGELRFPNQWNVKTLTTPISKTAEKWSREVKWSDEDGCWIGSLPEVCGFCCHSDNLKSVLEQLDVIANEYAKDKQNGLFEKYNIKA